MFDSKSLEFDMLLEQMIQVTKVDETDPILQGFASFVRPNYDRSAQKPDVGSLDPFQRILFAALARLDKKMTQIAEDVKGVDKRIDAMDQRFDRGLGPQRIGRNLRLDAQQRHLGTLVDGAQRVGQAARGDIG